MCFIKNHRSRLRQNPRIGCIFRRPLDGQIGEEQMVVDDNDVALHRPAVHLGNETGLKRTAFLAETSIRTRIQLVPESACLR